MRISDWSSDVCSSDLPPDQLRNADVRPHPHIGLSTVSYLFDGGLMHRDSLGAEQAIRPGEVNWMTAGRGIAHSERFDDPASQAGGAFEMIQRSEEPRLNSSH